MGRRFMKRETLMFLNRLSERARHILSNAAIALCVTSASMATAQSMDHGGHHHHDHSTEVKDGVEDASVILKNHAVLDQDGKQFQFVDELVSDKIVVFDFIFTSCTTVCPVTTVLLSKAHENLSDISDDELIFVSLSIDPNQDTPARLKAFADDRSANWTFVTGDKNTMDDLLVSMDAYTTNPEDHIPMLIIGDAKSGRFERHFGLPDPDAVEARVRKLLEARGAKHVHHHH